MTFFAFGGSKLCIKPSMSNYFTILLSTGRVANPINRLLDIKCDG